MRILHITCYIHFFLFFSFFYFSFLHYFIFLCNTALKSHTFYLVYCIFAIFIVRHFLCSLMAFGCQEIKGLLTYLLIDIRKLSEV